MFKKVIKNEWDMLYMARNNCPECGAVHKDGGDNWTKISEGQAAYRIRCDMCGHKFVFEK